MPSHADRAPKDLGDFTTTPRVVPIALLAVLIGVLASYVALALLRMIAFFTNVFSSSVFRSTTSRQRKIISDIFRSRCRSSARSLLA